MKIGFDLDGTIDSPQMSALVSALLKASVEVHIITGVFDEAGEWQNADAKIQKLQRHGIPAILMSDDMRGQLVMDGFARVHVLHAMDTTYPRDYRLVDLALRKGALCDKLGIIIYVEDSELFANHIPHMSRGTQVLLVK